MHANQKTNADVVLIDGPPLDRSVEGALLAAYSDGALPVVRPRRTRRKDLPGG